MAIANSSICSTSDDLNTYLAISEVIDWHNPDVLTMARELAAGLEDKLAIARLCFEWVRDEIPHSHDYQIDVVTCRASEVLAARTGYCYAKSHLLAALLRANAIPAGFCYQRLCRDDNGQRPYSLHGLNGIYLNELGWYRVDPRGNKSGVNAQFAPPQEQLAYFPSLAREADFPYILSEPHPAVVQALSSHSNCRELWEQLPAICQIVFEHCTRTIYSR
jgi:transglutaminase-like putative cysteine protease